MDKKYQIFISSTFVDLIDERQAVLKTILELNHMPAGMELFPATDDSAWTLIKDVINASDYYVLIIGGRYGSTDEEGIGYTEKEYQYAVSTDKPVIPLLHKDPESLPRTKTETTESAWNKLQEFRKIVETKHTCVYWTNADELKAQVIIGLTTTIKKKPAIGWVRADKVPTDATVQEILSLKQQLADLTQELESTRTTPPPGTEDLMQGDDTFGIHFSVVVISLAEDHSRDGAYTGTIYPSWNDIFAGVAPVLIDEATETKLKKELHNSLIKVARKDLKSKSTFNGCQFNQFDFDPVAVQTCIVQLRAIGLIKESIKKRSLKDTETYWSLTPYGDRLMVQLRAIRRKPKVPQKFIAKEDSDI